LPYTSARLRTKDKRDQKYGRFEILAKLPTGQGTWPAIWMLPTENKYGTWAASGEIDIMEAVNPADGFHTYAIESEEGEIRRYVDNLHYATQTQDGWYSQYEKEKGLLVIAKGAAPFDEKFHLLLNLAIGGSWFANANQQGVDDSDYPRTMLVDYVKVY
jgi:beta-glucanase (GH16 family)